MLLAATAYETVPTTEATNTLTKMASQWQHADSLLATGFVTRKGDHPRIVFSPTDPTMVALTNSNGILSPDEHMITSVNDFGVITLIDTRLHRGILVETSRVAVQPDNEHLTAVSANKFVIYSIKNSNAEGRSVMSPHPG
ncbi:MAG: hypothetical protein JO309_07045 [Pseudonocardiales bacterium]|nr:hypothetical protein [Pseudonocardiales bacterium]MBV9729150.1 hypothetical protein [Pseudonocardiales bacterium]